MEDETRQGASERRTSEVDERTAERVVRALADGGFDAEFFHRVVERVGVGVGVYDESGRFTYVNDAYADLLGRDASDVIGMRVWHVNPELDGERFDAYWNSFEPGQTREHEGRHRTGDGETVFVETVTTAVEVDGTRYHVGTVADVTARVEGVREARRQDERLEEFASVVSHDLRNPLNVAMGRVELAATECDSEHLDHVERSLDRMEALIEDVLTLAREGSRLTDPEVIDVGETVRTAWYTSGGSEATLEVVDDLAAVESEESRLTQLFENLVANALQHGGDDVTVRVGRLDDGFYVEDDGDGIAEDDREDVFEYGYSTSQDGTGFGLTIVKEIAETHDWTVELVESEAGGTRFEFHDVTFVE